MNNEKKVAIIVKWLKEQLNESGMDGFIFGLSGGIDSALLAAILAKYFPKNYLAIRMNINNKEEDILDQKTLIKTLNLNAYDGNIEQGFELLVKNLKLEKAQQGNLGSRLRMSTLYALGQKLNYLVVGTGNYNELYLGYFTKYGDGAADLLPLANFTKQEIWDLAKYMNVPQKVIDKKPTAGFFHNQTDESDLGITYAQMEDFFQKRKVDLEVRKKMLNWNKKTKHKRNMPKSILAFSKLITKDYKNE